ncbi:MAG: NAD(P)H-dependent oxidoreductase [Saccharospirillaceae bacterium]|nr:NAD(P)H-dependent oxidoreductase [Pseudomonadales bacterium]NRB78897.1 NAD(P)H-dependent oxidoreductase [Saccharospirillaceae bacterium]
MSISQSKKVLIIKSSPSAELSLSNEIADFLIEQLKDQQVEIQFTIRDLSENPPPQLDANTIAAFYTPQEQLTADQILLLKPSLQYISELKDADIIVLASPMHNFSVSGLMKSYIDQICRIGLTFQYTEAGAQGLLTDKQAVIISSAGMDFQQDFTKSMDFQTPYLKHILQFIGLNDIHVIPVQGGAMSDEVSKEAKVSAQKSAIKFSLSLSQTSMSDLKAL